MHKVVLVTAGEECLPPGTAERIRAFADFRAQRCATPEELLATFPDAEVCWMFGPNLCLKPEALSKMPNLKALFRSGSGLDALPCDWAKEHGIGVYNAPETIAESVAEHTVALLISYIRQIPQCNARAKAGCEWGKVEGLDWHISHRTLGLIGYGNVARHVEKMMNGFDMKTLHYDPFAPDSSELDELLAKSDYVSIHCPLTPETKGLIDAHRLKLMKNNAILINTSRGPVVDEEALADALDAGTIGGAAIDVMSEEPPDVNSRLLRHPKCLVTPHVAAFSCDFKKNFFECSVKKIAEICNKISRGMSADRPGMRCLALIAAIVLACSAQAVEIVSRCVIADDGGCYIGWPSLTVLGDGTLMAVYSGQRHAHICPSGVVEVVCSADGGRTWPAPKVIGDTPIDDRDASIHRLPDGDILVTWFTSCAYATSSYWKPVYAAVEKRPVSELMRWAGRWCVRSRDGGRSWSAPERMSITGSTPHGGIVLKDGSLLWLGHHTPGGNDEASASTGRRTAICCERSTDGGRTWTMLCAQIPDMDGEGSKPHMFHEPHVAEMADDRLVALVRYHGEDRMFRRTESRDGGRTWTPMEKTSLKAGQTAPHLLALPDGRLLATYGLRDHAKGLAVGEYAAVSSDDGLTWSATDGICLRKSAEGVDLAHIGYPATVLLPGGDLYTVFYEPMDRDKKPCLMGVRWKL